GELRSDIRYRGVVLAGDNEFDISLSIVVDEPITDVRDVREVLPDRLFELLLRERPICFGYIIYGHGGEADIDGAVWNSSAVNEDACHLGALSHVIDKSTSCGLGIGELR